MPDYLAAYFHAEKQESAVFVAMGFASIAVALWVWRSRPAYRAMAYPLVAIALIQLVVGWTWRPSASVACSKVARCSHSTFLPRRAVGPTSRRWNATSELCIGP